ncbi:MAG: hypothetical protein J0L84_06465 [Verrucomicrobia bacterium]|nr:hypothetical protein [Verrucomicrobiota bacterium]
MNRSFAVLTSLAAVMLLSLSPTLTRAEDGAATSSSSESSRKEAPKGGFPFRGQVGSVDASARTVTLAGKKRDRVLHVTDQTRIERDGKSASLADIRPGDQARGSLMKDAEGREVLLKATFGERAAEGAGKTPAASPGEAPQQAGL